MVLFFFFKQKTAYEMRISDWSSDVCSSDLTITVARFCHEHHLSPWPLAIREIADGALTNAGQRSRQTAAPNRLPTPAVNAIARAPQNVTRTIDRMTGAPPARSEEHTSELPSLMRISYAVFCSKKKTNNINQLTH